MIGKVNWYSVQKRFGFVTAEVDGKNDQTRDYFFHESDILSGCELKAEDKVQFELGERNGRVKAINVQVVK